MLLSRINVSTNPVFQLAAVSPYARGCVDFQPDMNSAPTSLDLMTLPVPHITDKEEHIVPQQTFYQLDYSEQSRMDDSGIHSSPTTGQNLIEVGGKNYTDEEDEDEDEDDEDCNEEEDNNWVAELPSAMANLRINEDASLVKEPEANVIVCTETSLDEAKRLSQEAANNGGEFDIKPCNEESDFSSNCLPPGLYKTMYLLVDSGICDVMMRKRRLRDAVDDFFEEFCKTCKVYLVNRLPEKDYVRYERLRTQLPESVCEYKEITVSKELASQDGIVRPKRRKQVDMEYEPSAVLGATYLEKEAFENISADEKYVMVGSNCTMNIQRSSKQLVVVKQDGSCNVTNVQIVPPSTATKLLVVITTDPKDPVLENNLKREIDGELDVINICLGYLGGSVIAIRDGSIIIEIDVQPGKMLGSDQLIRMLKMIFQENPKVASQITEGTSLKADVDVKNVIPISKLKDYFSDTQKKEDIHKNCVDKKKYEALERELEDLKKSMNVVTVSVVLGDITEEKSEVIVNSTNSKLKLSDGEVSGKILQAAGTEIQDECILRHTSGVRIGEVAETGGGNLQCKKIYHITLMDRWISKQVDTEESLRKVLTKCLKQADASGHRSISIPALGTGKLKYDPEKVAEIIYDVCLNFRSSGLMEVRLVVHPLCTDVHKVFTDVDKRQKKAFSRSQSMPFTFQYSSPKPQIVEENSDFPKKMKVSWVKGDITKQKVDVVVNSTVPNLNLSSGPLSKAILEAAGDILQEECEKNYPGGIEIGQQAYTSGGSKWQHVYHVALWPWTDVPSLEERYKSLIKKCLLRAVDYGEHSIAFPLLGTGGLDYPAEDVARWLPDAVQEFQSDHPDSSLRQVNFVVNPKDSKSIKVLKGQGKL